MALSVLSSLQRLYKFTELTVSDENELSLTGWLHVASRNIEQYLDRNILIVSNTQYFDTIYRKQEYFVKAPPITSITSVKVDSSGDFTGSETTLSSSDYHIGTYDTSVVIDSEVGNVPRGLQIVYTGGLAYDAVRSRFAIENTVGTLTLGQWVQGGTSGSWGILKAVSASSIDVEVVQGIFEVGETLTQYNAFAGTVSLNTTGIASVTRRSLVEEYPDIVRACEMQVRYMEKHKHDFENAGTNADGTSLRRDSNKGYSLEPEVRALLDPYKQINYVV